MFGNECFLFDWARRLPYDNVCKIYSHTTLNVQHFWNILFVHSTNFSNKQSNKCVLLEPAIGVCLNSEHTVQV